MPNMNDVPWGDARDMCSLKMYPERRCALARERCQRHVLPQGNDDVPWRVRDARDTCSLKETMCPGDDDVP